MTSVAKVMRFKIGLLLDGGFGHFATDLAFGGIWIL